MEEKWLLLLKTLREEEEYYEAQDEDIIYKMNSVNRELGEMLLKAMNEGSEREKKM